MNSSASDFKTVEVLSILAILTGGSKNTGKYIERTESLASHASVPRVLF